MGKLIEGEIFSERECLLIEDLMTDGKSKIDFLLKIREHQITCRNGLVVFNYDIFPETKERLEEHKLVIHYLANWVDVYNVLKSLSNFDNSVIKEIKNFIDDPIHWSKNKESQRG